MLQLTPSTLEALQPWRAKYFDTLEQSQDMYSESLISWAPGAVCYTIAGNAAPVGYLVLNGSNELVEFFITADLLTQKEAVFLQLAKQLGIKSVYCKSFDQVLLSCCHKFSQSSKLVGYLFQNYSLQPAIAIDSALRIRLAALDDIPFLSSFENELLEEGEVVDPYVKNNSVYMFMRGSELVGCGYLFNIIPGRKHYDVGMWVNQPFRRKGYATQIVSYLMKHCFDSGFIPTAGCAEDNTVSRRTLEKCGFVSKHCLINFELAAL